MNILILGIFNFILKNGYVSGLKRVFFNVLWISLFLGVLLGI